MYKDEHLKIAQEIFELEKKIDAATSREEAKIYEAQMIKIVDGFYNLEDFVIIDEIIQEMIDKK